MNDDQIKHMVERFLAWRLPANFNPDNGIGVERPNYGPNVQWEPLGTNLFDYTQAEAMVRHMLEGLPPLDHNDRLARRMGATFENDIDRKSPVGRATPPVMPGG